MALKIAEIVMFGVVTILLITLAFTSTKKNTDETEIIYKQTVTIEEID